MVRGRPSVLFLRVVSLLAVATLLTCALLPGFMTQDVAAEAPAVEWVRQFGTSGDDRAWGVSTDAGGIYVGARMSGGSFVRKYDAAGNHLWSLQIDESVIASPVIRGISACASGIYSTGTGFGPISGDMSNFVCKCDAAGNELWTYSFAPSLVTEALAISADSGGVYVAGLQGVMDFYSFVRKYDADGNLVWSRQFTSDDGYAEARGISVASDGVYVVGYVTGALSGQTSQGGEDVFVCKYDANGDLLWTRQFGTASDDYARGVSASSSGIYVAGGTEYSASSEEGFVYKYDTNGNLVWFRLPGFAARTIVRAVSTDSTGVYVAGEAHEPAAAQGGAFVRKYDHSGEQMWTHQFGSDSDDSANGISTHSASIYVAGHTAGTLPSQVDQGGEDAFVMQITTNAPPAQPANLSPADGATSVSLTPSLQSSAFSDPDAGDTHMASQWQVRTSSGDYSSPAYDSNSTTTHLTSITLPSDELDYSSSYYWRVRHQDSNSAWSGWSMESGFTTIPLASAPSVTTNAATSIGTSSVTLNGDLTSLGTADNVWVCFEWGLTDSYGNTTTLQGPMWAPGAWSFPLSGLTPGTTYHFRAKADGGDGTAHGSDMTFITGQTPDVEDVDPSSGKRNQDLTVIISGSHLDGATAVSFGSGITVEDFTVTSSTEITADIAIDADATLGDREVSVTTEWGTATKADAFSVVGGGGGICGLGAPTTPSTPNEMATTLAALGGLLMVGYWLTRKRARTSGNNA